MLIDTHCHLYKEYYENIDEIITNMKRNNVYGIVNGCNEKTNKEAIELSKDHTNIYATIGYHPTELDGSEDNMLKFFEENKENIVAIGEIGLDYYWNKDNKEKQIKIFKKQLEFASKNKLPVIIHNREATKDVYDILKDYNLKGIIHAFSGSYETAIEFVKLGYKLGIGGVLTFKNSKLKDILERIDINDIVLETDSPYLTPEPNRGKQNNPNNLKYIAKYISDIKNVSYEDVCNITSNTAIQLFDLDIQL